MEEKKTFVIECENYKARLSVMEVFARMNGAEVIEVEGCGKIYHITVPPFEAEWPPTSANGLRI